MSTYRIPAGFELIGMTTATGEFSWVVLHLRNRETGLDELTRIMAASIPEITDTRERQRATEAGEPSGTGIQR